MTALIFGGRGQDGFYLSRLLKEKGVATVSVSRSASADLLAVDVADRAQVESLIQQSRPEYIFHLAANSTTRYEALFENHATISGGTLNILDAVKKHAPEARVFLSGSALQFENSGSPISERAAFAALNTYAIARIQSVYAGRYYRSLGHRVYVGYFFHHDSPRRGPNHVSQIVAQAARRIAMGSSEVLELGDITVRKEWGFAGDIVRAVWQLVNQDSVFEAVIGTGEAYSIGEFVERCFALSGRRWRDHVKVREGFTPEYRCLVSDPSTMRSLGWRNEVDLAGLAAMMVNGEASN